MKLKIENIRENEECCLSVDFDIVAEKAKSISYLESMMVGQNNRKAGIRLCAEMADSNGDMAQECKNFVNDSYKYCYEYLDIFQFLCDDKSITMSIRAGDLKEFRSALLDLEKFLTGCEGEMANAISDLVGDRNRHIKARRKLLN